MALTPEAGNDPSHNQLQSIGVSPAGQERTVVETNPLDSLSLPSRPAEGPSSSRERKVRRSVRRPTLTVDSPPQQLLAEDVTREAQISSHIQEKVSNRSRWEDYRRSTLEMLRISPAKWMARLGLTAVSAGGVAAFTYCMSQGIVALGEASSMVNGPFEAVAAGSTELLAPIGRALTWLVSGALAFQAGRWVGMVNDTISDAHTLEVDLRIEKSLGSVTDSLLEDVRQREDVSELLTLAEEHQASSKELVNGIMQLSQEVVELAMSVGVLVWSGAGPTVIPIALGGYLTYRSARRCSRREVTAEQDVNKLYQLYEDGHRALTSNSSISNLQQMHAYERVFDQVIDIKAHAERIRNEAKLANRRDDLKTDSALWIPVLGSAVVATSYFWQGAYDGATLIWAWMTLYPLQDQISTVGGLLSAQATDLELASSRHALTDLSKDLGDSREKIILKEPCEVSFDKVRLRRRGSNRDTVKETSFSIAPGMSVAVVGNNGQGKSSLLGLISGRILPSSGNVFVGSHSTREKNVLIGNLSQDFTLIPGLTVRENIEIYKTGEGGLSADEVIDRLGIREILFDNKPQGIDTIIPGINQKGTNFSGGQRQLIALAQAVASEPGLLVLDEPLSALGPSMQAHINSVLLSLERRPTIFFATHKYEQANSCDWILVIEKGDVVEQGRPEELLSKYRGKYKSLYRQQRKLADRRGVAKEPRTSQRESSSPDGNASMGPGSANSDSEIGFAE